MATFVCVVCCVAGAVAASAQEPEPFPFPNLSLTSLEGGETIDLASLRGNPVLLAFWASWCGPCRVELPELVELTEELEKTGFTLLTVNLDRSPGAAHRFMAMNELDLPVYRLNPRDLMALGIQAVPTNILLNGDGAAVRVYEGYSPTVAGDIRDVVAGMAKEETEGDGTT